MWQKCPVCNGSGNTYNTLSSSSFSVCSVCKGSKIISELNGLPPNYTNAVTSNDTQIITYEELQKLKNFKK